ncbi:helix-turn-helix transcriptional regulator [Bilophila wadsworthia]|uniref:helix-turn-helix transcriptional regulator n=1 Tax=Bilophila wadsworthia TaxID=35833 RepID=UPI003C6C5958
MQRPTNPFPLEIPHLLRIHQVQRFFPVSKATLYNLIAKGAFPAPLKVGRASFWRSSDVLEYVRSIGWEA